MEKQEIGIGKIISDLMNLISNYELEFEKSEDVTLSRKRTDICSIKDKAEELRDDLYDSLENFKGLHSFLYVLVDNCDDIKNIRTILNGLCYYLDRNILDLQEQIDKYDRMILRIN